MVFPGFIKALGRPVLRLMGLRPPDYWSKLRYGEMGMANIELAGLVKAIRMLDRAPRSIIEIGSFCGGSTVVIARAAARLNRRVKVYAIDPFVFHELRYQQDYESLFDRNVADWNLQDVVVKIKARSEEAVASVPSEIDFLFVDGDHEYEAVVSDIRNFVPRVRPGGLLMFHDYKPVGKEGVRRAIDELIIPRYERVFYVGSLICFRWPRTGA